MSRAGLSVELVGLTKKFGSTTAVDDLSFTVEPGVVTGFLGPNGAGKTTTLRCLLGLLRPTSGRALIGGRPYRDLPDPLGTVGAALEASGFHPGRTARAHLQVLALGAGVDRGRVDLMLAQVGLADVADRPVGGFSLGMRQRLALAAALLGDPRVLLLDEPANGLDPAGIAWLRDFLRLLAREGRTVLVSSHVLTEVQQTVDHVVVLSRGRLVGEGSLAELGGGESAVLVRTPEPERLRAALLAGAGSSEGVEEAPLKVSAAEADGRLRVVGRTAAEVGHAAFVAGVELHELTTEPGDLERAFLALTTEAEGERSS